MGIYLHDYIVPVFGIIFVITSLIGIIIDGGHFIKRIIIPGTDCKCSLVGVGSLKIRSL